MDYILLAKKVLMQYPISNPSIKFIRHNENMTYKITDEIHNKCYLLRIHKPAIEGLLGIQHTFTGIKSEIDILQELNFHSKLKVQKPVANCQGEYISKYDLDGSPCYFTLLEWIDGNTFTLKEDNAEDIVYALGESLALFHECTRKFMPHKDFKRPIYDMDRIDYAIGELKYCVHNNIFSMSQYQIICEVLNIVKNQIKVLNLMDNSYGIIHADLQLGNIIINKGKPCLIDFGFSGFGYYLFDLGSAASMLESKFRKTLLNGYASKSFFSFNEIRCIEGFIFMDIFISYVFFMRDPKNTWIKNDVGKTCDILCNKFLKGEEVFYSF